MMDIRQLREGEYAQRRALLKDHSLTEPLHPDATLGAFDGAGRLIGCCSLVGDMLQGLAVTRTHLGEGIAAALIQNMIQLAAAKGIYHLCVITKPELAAQLRELGLTELAVAPPHAAFFEFGGGIEPYLKSLHTQAENKPMPRGCVILNANPFTLGHLFLLEQACRACAWVFALVVEEDRSEIPFRDRLALVCEGSKELGNLSVLPGGRYVISDLTFPSYFTKQADLAVAEGSLDAVLFAEKIAPALGVTKRYVGAEPSNSTTRAYNQALKERLPQRGIALVELPRLEHMGAPISATTVRTHLIAGDLAPLKPLVPKTTYDYLAQRHGNA